MFDLQYGHHGYYFIFSKKGLDVITGEFFAMEVCYPYMVQDLFNMEYYDFIDQLVMRYNAHTAWSPNNQRYNVYFTRYEDGKEAIEEYLDPLYLMRMLSL